MAPLLKTISEFLYPEDIKCIICDRDLPYKSKTCVCEKCGLKYNVKYCLTCGRGISHDGDYCVYCKSSLWHFKFARSRFEFEGDFKGLIYRFKYGGERFLAKYLSAFIIESVKESIRNDNIGFDFITYVPLHKKRFKKRGYNQSMLLAKYVSDEFEKPLIPALIKNRASKNLAKLNAEERKKAIDGSFSIDYNIVAADKNEAAQGKSYIKGLNVLLIDDILTTGATADECAKTLKSAAVNNIYVFTAASLRSRSKLI